jgi:hypothetical protein
VRIASKCLLGIRQAPGRGLDRASWLLGISDLFARRAYARRMKSFLRNHNRSAETLADSERTELSIGTTQVGLLRTVGFPVTPPLSTDWRSEDSYTRNRRDLPAHRSRPFVRRREARPAAFSASLFPRLLMQRMSGARRAPDQRYVRT